MIVHRSELACLVGGIVIGFLVRHYRIHILVKEKSDHMIQPSGETKKENHA